MRSEITPYLIFGISEHTAIKRVKAQVLNARTRTEQGYLVEAGYTGNQNKAEFVAVFLDR